MWLLAWGAGAYGRVDHYMTSSAWTGWEDDRPLVNMLCGARLLGPYRLDMAKRRCAACVEKHAKNEAFAARATAVLTAEGRI